MINFSELNQTSILIALILILISSLFLFYLQNKRKSTKSDSNRFTSRQVFSNVLNVENEPMLAFESASWYIEHLLEKVRLIGKGKVKGSDLNLHHLNVLTDEKDLLYGEFVDSDTFEKRMLRNYDNLVQKEVVEWELGNETPRFPTREQWDEWILNSSPFNLVDGAWLSGAVSKAGPIATYDNTLLNIWMDEVGKGKHHENHATLWNSMLEALKLVRDEWRLRRGSSFVDMTGGLLNSSAFVHDTALLEQAFDNAALQLAASLYGRRYAPEIMGMTLWLEFFASPMNARLAREVVPFGVPPNFFQLHGTIDNISSGHGRQALDAVNQYLATFADKFEREAAFRRVWDGVLLFHVTFESYMPALSAKFAALPSKQEREAPRAVIEENSVSLLAVRAQLSQLTAKQLNSRMISLVKSKAHAAKSLHGHTTLDGKLLNWWFANAPTKLVQKLAVSGHVVPGNAELSPLTNELVEFGGAMFCIFTDEELELLRAWIRSLGDETPVTSVKSNANTSKVSNDDVIDRVLSCIDTSVVTDVERKVASHLARKQKAGARSHASSTLLHVGKLWQGEETLSLNELLASDKVDGVALVKIMVKLGYVPEKFRALLAPDGAMKNVFNANAKLDFEAWCQQVEK